VRVQPSSRANGWPQVYTSGLHRCFSEVKGFHLQKGSSFPLPCLPRAFLLDQWQKCMAVRPILAVVLGSGRRNYSVTRAVELVDRKYLLLPTVQQNRGLLLGNIGWSTSCQSIEEY
jgi:hypothetical protein